MRYVAAFVGLMAGSVAMAGAVELPHTHERRLFRVVGVQGFALPVLPFAGSVKRDPTSRERGP